MSSSDATVNTTTGTHPVDPYKSQNFEDPPLIQKIEELTAFIAQVKFGMLTTHQSEGEYLTSRCMALAAQVCPQCTYTFTGETAINKLTRNMAVLT
jgi:hypothetical protein